MRCMSCGVLFLFLVRPSTRHTSAWFVPSRWAFARLASRAGEVRRTHTPEAGESGTAATRGVPPRQQWRPLLSAGLVGAAAPRALCSFGAVVHMSVAQQRDRSHA